MWYCVGMANGSSPNVKVRMTAHELARLKGLASRNERTISQEIRLAIRERLDREEEKQ